MGADVKCLTIGLAAENSALVRPFRTAKRVALHEIALAATQHKLTDTYCRAQNMDTNVNKVSVQNGSKRNLQDGPKTKLPKLEKVLKSLFQALTKTKQQFPSQNAVLDEK